MARFAGFGRSTLLLNLRRLVRSPLRAALTIGAVGGGVAVAVAVAVVITSIDGSIERLLRDLAGPAPLRVLGPADRGGLFEDVVERVAAVDGVDHAVPAVQAVAIAEDAGGTEHSIFVVGVDCRVEALVGAFACTEADMNRPDDRPLLLSVSLARRLGPGGVIRTNVGRVPVDGVELSPFLEDVNSGNIAVFALPTAQRVFDRDGRLDAVYVLPEAGASVAVVQARVAEVAGATSMVLGRDEVPVGDVASGPLVPMLVLVAVFALGIAALLVYNTMTLALLERRRDLAIATSTGGTRAAVVGGAIIETTVLGLAGGLVGAAGGVALAHPLVASLNAVILRQEAAAITVDVRVHHLVLGVVIGAAAAGLAGVVPALRSARIDIAAELHGRAHREEAKPRAAARRCAALTLLGAAAVAVTWAVQRGGGLEGWQATLGLLAMITAAVTLFAAAGAATPLLLGRLIAPAARAGGVLHLAATGAAREPRRTSVVAVAVATSVGMAAILGSLGPAIRGGVQETIAKSIDGRVYVSTLPINNSSSFDSGVPEPVLERLASVEGVASVDRNSFISLRDPRGDISVAGFSGYSAIPYEILAGSIDDPDLEPGEALIGPSLARSLDLRPGDTLRLPAPRGWAAVTVQAIWADPNNNGSTVTVAQDFVIDVWGKQRASDVLVRPEAGVDATELVRRIEAADLDPDLYALTPSAMGDKLSGEVERQADPFWALQRALLVVTLIAALSTLLLVGVQRRRELAILGAVGLSGSGLARMTLVEGGVIAIAASVIGTVASMGVFSAMLNVSMLQIGIRPPFTFALTTPVIYAGITSVVVLVGAAIPAWRTSRLQIVDALHFE